MNNEALLSAITEISKAISEPSIFDIIATGISLVSLITTIVVIYFNYRAVKAAKESVEVAEKSLELTKLEMQKSIDIQLYDRRLTVASHIEQDNYCDSVMEVALLFGNETCLRIKKIKELLHEKAQLESAHERYMELLAVCEHAEEYQNLENILMSDDDSIPSELYQKYRNRYEELDSQYAVITDYTNEDNPVKYDIYEICREESRLTQEIEDKKGKLKMDILKMMRQKLSLEAN